MKTKRIATLLLIILIALNFSTGVVYAATSSPETVTPAVSETAAPEPSSAPTPEKTPKETDKPTDKPAEINESDIDYTPYLSVIIFLLSGILGVLIGHFVIYRIK